jgi:hypothetical protein
MSLYFTCVAQRSGNDQNGGSNSMLLFVHKDDTLFDAQARTFWPKYFILSRVPHNKTKLRRS